MGSITTHSIYLTPSNSGLVHEDSINITESSAAAASELLRKNHEQFHVFWNFKKYHNHQAHYLLTAYALGADPEKLQHAFDSNTHYQRQIVPLNEEVIGKLSNDDYFISLLGDEDHFHNFLAFFDRKMAQIGAWQAVLQQYLFSRSQLAEDMLSRLFAGLVHPIIHLGFGIEFEQPGIVAEALAQIASHQDYFAPYFFGSEKLSKEPGSGPDAALVDLVEECSEDPSLLVPEHWDGGDSTDDAYIGIAPKNLYPIAARWRVAPEDLEEKTAEMINVNAYMAGSAQRPPKEYKIDFWFMHEVNCSVFFTAINKQPWLSIENKARLIEWKGRTDLITHCARLGPKLIPDQIRKYKPKFPNMTWPLLIERVLKVEDDGHISKFLRAVMHGSKVCAKYADREELAHRFPLKPDGWLQLGNMCIDTTADCVYIDRWVRGAGAAKSWEKFKDRSKDEIDSGVTPVLL